MKPISYKFIACIFAVLIVAIMGIWCLYKLSDMLATQAFIFSIGSIVTIIIAYITGNVIGDHYFDRRKNDKNV